LAEFHRHLSADSVYSRYFEFLKLDQRIAHERLARQCLNEEHRATALVAEQLTTSTGNREIVGVVRLSVLPEAGTAEFALVVGDPWQRRGIGAKLLNALLQLARDEGIKKVSGDVLPDNFPMKHLACRAGFHIRYDSDGRSSKMEISL
jgi:acetyltransferase